MCGATGSYPGSAARRLRGGAPFPPITEPGRLSEARVEALICTPRRGSHPARRRWVRTDTARPRLRVCPPRPGRLRTSEERSLAGTETQCPCVSAEEAWAANFTNELRRWHGPFLCQHHGVAAMHRASGHPGEQRVGAGGRADWPLPDARKAADRGAPACVLPARHVHPS